TTLFRPPGGTSLRLLLTAANSALAPADLLALAKHPLAAAGDSRARFAQATRKAERRLLRGPSPEPGFAGLRKQAAAIADAERRAETEAGIDRLGAATGEL